MSSTILARSTLKVIENILEKLLLTPAANSPLYPGFFPSALFIILKYPENKKPNTADTISKRHRLSRDAPSIAEGLDR
jgi:hypothetical protein